MTTRFRDGSVTVTLDDGLERFVRDALSAAERETVRILEEAAAQVRADSEPKWYAKGTGVERETGKSGTLTTVTTFDANKGEVRVSLGSTDTRVAGKSGKPVPLFVHRPFPLSTTDKTVTRKEWYEAPASMRLPIVYRNGKPFKPMKGRPVNDSQLLYRIAAPNPDASDGKYLVAELIRKPMTAKVKAITPALGQAIATRVNRG